MSVNESFQLWCRKLKQGWPKLEQSQETYILLILRQDRFVLPRK